MIAYTPIEKCTKCGKPATSTFWGRCNDHPTRNMRLLKKDKPNEGKK